ncbi:MULTISPECIES: hypothetical protein [unclassified Streptomyces]|uniref:hypothetical protein n=1 Tax=unclassified Streptomyces TaxID=2593676 RepID=UPI002E2418DE|nr:hypothetical protein OG217_37045 [Streptomyces sp. NBC_01023]WSX47456.1 hypothetical protein OG760_37790 [Streptomyces sp. NBC_00963]
MPPLKKNLDADEERVTRAHRLLIGLGAALVHHPFDVATHERLRAFLSDDAETVLMSLRVLEQRPEAELRKRIAELCGHHLLPLGGTA